MDNELLGQTITIQGVEFTATKLLDDDLIKIRHLHWCVLRRQTLVMSRDTFRLHLEK